MLDNGTFILADFGLPFAFYGSYNYKKNDAKFL